jgi:hypothetical protein
MDLSPPTDPNSALPDVESSWPCLYTSASVQEIEKTKRLEVIDKLAFNFLAKREEVIQCLQPIPTLWKESSSIIRSLASVDMVIIYEDQEEQDDNAEASFDQRSDFGCDVFSWGEFCWEYYDIYKDIYGDGNDRLKRLNLALLVLLVYLAFMLQTILQYLLLFCKFAEFPNRRRPKCTTMPWNIWPSLVVLWGVCWMFYPHSSHQDHTPDEFLLNDEYLPVFHPSKTP